MAVHIILSSVSRLFHLSFCLLPRFKFGELSISEGTFLDLDSVPSSDYYFFYFLYFSFLLRVLILIELSDDYSIRLFILTPFVRNFEKSLLLLDQKMTS